MSLAATWADLEIVILCEVRERQIWYHLYVDYKKKLIWVDLFTEQTHRLHKQTDGYQTEKVGEIN